MLVVATRGRRSTSQVDQAPHATGFPPFFFRLYPLTSSFKPAARGDKVCERPANLDHVLRPDPGGGVPALGIGQSLSTSLGFRRSASSSHLLLDSHRCHRAWTSEPRAGTASRPSQLGLTRLRRPARRLRCVIHTSIPGVFVSSTPSTCGWLDSSTPRAPTWRCPSAADDFAHSLLDAIATCRRGV